MNQRVCITGASRGIGLGFTEHYLREGCQVLAIARQASGRGALQKLQETYGSRLECVDADVTQIDQLQSLRDRWTNQGLDVLINNAGVSLDASRDFSKLPLQALRDTYEVNVLAPVALTQLALPALQKGQNPRVIMISSLMGSIGDNSGGGYYAYRSSKSALNMITRSLSVDYPWLTAVAMHPGWVQTDMGGSRAPISVAESVRNMTRVIAEVDKKLSGSFLNYDGKSLPW